MKSCDHNLLDWFLWQLVSNASIAKIIHTHCKQAMSVNTAQVVKVDTLLPLATRASVSSEIISPPDLQKPLERD